MSNWAATDSVVDRQIHVGDGAEIDVGTTADLASAGVCGGIWLGTGCGRGGGLPLRCGLMASLIENGEDNLVRRQKAY